MKHPSLGKAMAAVALVAWLNGCTGGAAATDGGADVAVASDVSADVSTDIGGDAMPAGCVSDDECSDGLFCNGVERCSTGAAGANARGCVSVAAGPCTAGQSCDEAGDRCADGCPDADRDGHRSGACGGDDCDDADPMRYPGRAETCDADGHDEDCDPCTVAGAGGDGDGDSDTFVGLRCLNRFRGAAPTTCDPQSTRVDAARMVVAGVDCDDADRNVRPSQTEACNGRDDNCNGMVDEGATRTVYPDDDGDGYGERGATPRMIGGCALPAGFSETGTDCDDTVRMINPAATERCDGVDNNCDGVIDNGGAGGTFYRDVDGDGRGDQSVTMTRSDCAAPDGWVARVGDCNDRDATVYVAAPELCDGVDNDCSLSGEAAGGADPTEDRDGDHHAPTSALCSGGAFARDDCDDDRAAVRPGAAETCNGLDDDCDGMTDEEPAASAACTLLHASSVCRSGACAVGVCAAPFLDCNGVAADGCEVDPTTSASHCGACGRSCGVGGMCAASACDRFVQLVTPCNGSYGVCVVRSGGGVVGWGVSSGGTPTVQWQVLGLSSLSNGPNALHCALLSSGVVQCWGSNDYGQLGDGTGTTRFLGPGLPVVGLTDAVDVAAGQQHACALRATGAVVCWGSYWQGSLGDGRYLVSGVPQATPLEVAGISSIVQLSVGGASVCARSGAGAVWCWGTGAIPVDSGISARPTSLREMSDAVDVVVRGQRACAVGASGRVVCWGYQYADRPPTFVTGLTDAVTTGVALRHMCAIRRSGSVVCWGDNAFGQLGNGTTIASPTPVAVVGVDDAVQVQLGDTWSCVMRRTGAVSCWGDNRRGILGAGSTSIFSSTPVPTLAPPP